MVHMHARRVIHLQCMCSGNTLPRWQGTPREEYNLRRPGASFPRKADAQPSASEDTTLTMLGKRTACGSRGSGHRHVPAARVEKLRPQGHHSHKFHGIQMNLEFTSLWWGEGVLITHRGGGIFRAKLCPFFSCIVCRAKLCPFFPAFSVGLNYALFFILCL